MKKLLFILVLLSQAAFASDIENKLKIDHVEFKFVKFMMEFEGKTVPVFLRESGDNADRFCKKMGYRDNHYTSQSWTGIKTHKFYSGNLDTDGNIVDIQYNDVQFAWASIHCEL